ncbi:MAG: nitroreductase family protein [Gammaproteobacteria bacterium]|nr:nitroreductase family protein [Gammaproteobacteria bacterium]
MELVEILGRRRSIRFVKPYKPVEEEKIQAMFEAARIASHWGNVQSLRGVAVFRNDAPQEVLDALQAVVLGWQIKLAPVTIVWYVQPDAVDEQADRLREVTAAGAMGFGGKEGRMKALEEVLLPIFEGIRDSFKAPGLNEVDCGQGIAQATLMAYELGLGTCCLGSPQGPQILKALGVPDPARLLLLQTVGYPLEHWEAGGQRPRMPFEKLFHKNSFKTPFPRSEKVVAELTEKGMFTTPGPLPERDDELEFLKHALGLKGHGLL